VSTRGKVYRVRRLGFHWVVCKVARPDGESYWLPHILCHSPDGFGFGYGGSGPADLALSLTVDATGERDGYQQVKWSLVATMSGEDGEVTEEQIREVVEAATRTIPAGRS
jgi:hypothetical protein